VFAQMGYQVLARKYRPQRFADVAGQDHVTRTLLNALSQSRIAHGYIFSGHRGIGKTTIARILAQALNCRTEIGSPQRPTPEPCGVCDSCVEIRQGNAVDVIEIDAATNRGIDEIRELREAARYSPARDRYKIYILDEAHQITEAAFNALLKTLEEPPAHVIFMMATTEPENIPQTIRSRCQHFSFHAVKFDDILAQLKAIAAHESVDAEDAALALLAEAGDGSMRDALSIMDQAIASAPMKNGRPALAATQIRELMGSVPNAVFERLLEAVAAGQSVELMEQLNVLLNAGHSPSSLARQMVRYLRNTLMARIGGEQTELLQISADERARAARTALLFGEEELTRNLQIVLRTFDDLNYRQEQRFHLELGLLKLIHAQRLLPIEELLSGAAGSGGARSAPPPASVPRATPAAPRASAATLPASRPTPKPATPPSISPFGASADAWAPTPVAASAAPVALAEVDSATAVPVEMQNSPHAAGSGGTSMMNGAAHPAQEAANSGDVAVSVLSAVSGAAAEEPEPAESSAATLPESAPGESADTAMLSAAIVAALTAAGHGSAGQLLGSGAWIIDGGNLRIEVALMSKKMLGLTVNAAAEKIIKQELQRLGGPSRFLVVPGAGGGTHSATSAATMAAPITGSIEQEALAHPLVQRARDIFHAEVRSVVDLRPK
jgi:DNA polymerase-3 subunit gamma/tau